MNIIGIDHGYAAIKTSHFSFSSGIVEYEHEPYTNKNVLEYAGKYYVCGTGRQPLVQDTEPTGEPEPSSITIIVTVSAMTSEEAAEHYGFDENQYEMLSVMNDPFLMPMYAELLGVDVYGGATGGDISDIISNLPPNEKSSIIVEAALGKIGVAYSTMDCSDLSEYAYAQAGIDIPGTAAAQAEFCYNNGFNVGKDELQPGDLIFWAAPNKNSTRWNKIHHVGIYVGDGMIVDASSSKGRVVYREIWGSEPTASGWTIKGGGRPVSN